MNIKTTLQIGANTDGIDKAGKKTKEAFNPKVVKEFNAVAKDVEKTLVGLVRQQTALGKTLAGVAKGTKEYKALRQELRAINNAAKDARSSLGAIEDLHERASRRAREGAGRNFMAGLGQGTGLGQYMPTDPGMGWRMAGQAVGGGVRRGANAVSSPFITPGIGGVTQGLSGIPVVGGFAAGALSTAAASYGSAVSYDQARKNNLYFASHTIGTRRGASDEDRARVSQSEAELAAAQAAQRNEAQQDPGAFRRMVRSPGGRWLGMPKLFDEGKPNPETEARVTKAEIALQAAKEAARDSVDSGLGGLGLGQKLGYGPQEVQALMGEFFGARGGQRDRRSNGEFETALAAQARFGISAGQSGAFARGGMAGGGGAEDQNLESILAGAFAQGLKGSQIQEYLGTLVDLQTAAEQRGIKVDPSSFERTSMLLSGGGFGGAQAARITGSLTTSAQSLADRGVSNPMDVLMMRAAGFKPGQGIGGYEDAQRKLEEGDPDTLQAIMKSITEGAGGEGASGSSLFVKRALKAMGVNLGFGQADNLLQGMARGEGGEAVMRLDPKMLALKEKRLSTGALQSEAETRVSAGAGRTVTAAGLEAQRIGVGQRSDFVAKFESAQITAGNVMANFGKDLSALANVVKTAMKALEKVTAGGSGINWLAGGAH